MKCVAAENEGRGELQRRQSVLLRPERCSSDLDRPVQASAATGSGDFGSARRGQDACKSLDARDNAKRRACDGRRPWSYGKSRMKPSLTRAEYWLLEAVVERAIDIAGVGSGVREARWPDWQIIPESAVWDIVEPGVPRIGSTFHRHIGCGSMHHCSGNRRRYADA